MDYSGDGAGANAGIYGSYGTIESLLLYKCIGSVSTGADATKVVSVGKFEYFSLPTNGGSSTPDIRMAFPNNVPFSGFAPLFWISPASSEYVACNTTNNEILVDYVFPSGFNVITNTCNYSAGTRSYQRTVNFNINDSSGNPLSSSSLYIYSGSNVLVNAVQSGNFSSPLLAAYLSWVGRSGNSYIPALTSIDTRSQTAQIRKTGYVSQTVNYSLQDSAYSQTLFMLLDPAMGSVTATQAAALTGISPNYSTNVLTLSSSHNLDEVYAYGSYSLAQTANSAQVNYQSSSGGVYSLNSPWTMNVTAGTLTMGSYNQTFNSSTGWVFTGSTAALTLNKNNVTWTPATYAAQLSFANGATFNISNGAVLTVNETAALGYGSPEMFGENTTLNMSNSTFIYNVLSGASGTFFSASTGNATWNISNSTWTFNSPNTSVQIAVHAYISSDSIINGWTINGTAASAVVLQFGYTTNNQKLYGLNFAGSIFGNGTSNVLMDTYTYAGVLSSIPSSYGSSNKWWFIDPVMSSGGVFKWTAGSTPTGVSGYYGVIGYRPTFTINKPGFSPSMRITPSAMSSRYPSKIFNTTAQSTVSLSNFYRDPTFMGSTDGFLPFVDSLDDKTVLNAINWTINTRQAGWLDQTVIFNSSTALKGAIANTFSGAVDSNYVNATTALADSSLITVNTTTNTISAVSGTLTWSPQRLYNALKNWWATYASDVDFLSATGSGFLDLGNYSVDSTIVFGSTTTGDALIQVRTTGTLSNGQNSVPVTANVTQISPTNLSNVSINGNLTYNTNTNTTITLSNCSISGTISNSGTGQISIINNGSTIGSLGLNIAPPIITATLTLSGLNGDSLYVTDSNGNQKAYVASSGSNYSLDVTGGTGVWSVKVAKYGFFSQSFTFTPANGGVFSFVPVLVSDPSISQASATLVGAYTTVNNPDQIYDLCALYETTNAGIAYPNMATKQNKFVLLAYGYVFASTGVVFSFANNIITLNCTSFSSGATFTSGLTTLGSANTGTATLNYPVLANGSNGENTWLTLSLTPGDEVYVSDNNGVTKDNVTASSSQYTFGAPAGSTGSWNYIIGQYGYTQQTGSFTPTGGLINQTITPVLDTSITTQNKTVVSSYTILDTAAKVYDYAALYATTPSGILEGSPVAISGITLNFGSKNVVIDANAALVYSYSGNTVTIKASILTAEIITNGTVTYLNGATVKGIVSDSTGYTGEVDISGLTGCSVAIVEDTGAIYSFNPNVTGNLSISIPSSYKGTWKAIVTKFAQKPVSVSFALQSGNPTAIAYVAIPDTGVIDSLSDVSAYSQLNSTQQMYDYFSYWNTTQQGIEFINSVSWSGSVLNCGNANILFDANASANASLNPLTLQVTIKTSSMSGDILTTGTVTRANGAVTTGLVTDSTGTTAIITFTGLSTNDAYYIENASGVMQSYGLATSGTFTSYLLPSQQSAGNWSWSLKRPGYAAQAGVISVLGGGRFNIQAVWAKMLQPDGSVMFDGAQEAAGLTVDFTGANNTPRIKVGNTSYTPRQVFDACEYALITQSGMKWLAEGNDGIQVASLSTGNFIFMSAGWRVMQSASTNVNSTINAFVISSDGYVVDGTNGPVAFLSATSALPTDKIIELDDIYAIVQTLPTLAQVMAQIERSNGMLAQVQTSVDAIGT